ncbi:MAG: phosphoribosylaminoimidazolesuccinocarboxamide synthase [Kineosporiaceae bacterium]|nr:phosphoribosylaminoimidazolesuccinocarboxamide synthase [Kineosporiaceae bacterium]
MRTPLALPGWRHVYSGKVRELYVPEVTGSGERAGDPAGEPAGEPAGDHVLVVATDRISAYDHVLDTPIPDKGRILTALSLWWFGRLAELVRHHVITTDVATDGADALAPGSPSGVPAAVAGRAMICRRLEMIPVECVARGYLAGSGLVEYRATGGGSEPGAAGSVCGVDLPPGLVDGSRLPEPIFTPATKAAVGEHDENVSYPQIVAAVGEATAARLRSLTLAIYAAAERIARDRGIVLADTKLEFGRLPSAAGDGEIVLGDEVLTPDSSRFWPAGEWQPGRAQPSFDKQYVRDWLTSPASGWDRTGTSPPPPLPAEVVERTRDRYVEAYERITGTRWIS